MNVASSSPANPQQAQNLETTGTLLKACDIQQLLREKIAVLTGGRDKNGRPVITFPFRENAEKTTFEELRHVLQYLHAIPCDSTKELGFIALIDMRHGMSWNAVKPILKTLHEHFPSAVHLVLILKPEKFWDNFFEKHKASIASTKYKFEINLISLDNLSKYIDQSQLTHEFDGSLSYDHDEWLEMRMELESFIWRSMDVLRMFDLMRNELENAQDPQDVDTAKLAIEDHSKSKKRITKTPVDQLEHEGQQLVHKLTGTVLDESGSGNGPVDSDYGSAGRDGLQVNPDFAAAAPHIVSLLDNLRTTRANLYKLWDSRKTRLDQCFHLKLFEQDADKMFQWLRQHIELFLANYADIGDSYEAAMKAQHQHEQFTRAAMNTYVSISHIMTVATRLREHYAKHKIETIANRLDRDWKLFMSAIDMRSHVLSMSLQFHFKADQYLANVETWGRQCYGGDSEIPSTVPALEASVHDHEQLMENITRAYGEAVGEGNALLYALKNPPPLIISGSAAAASVSNAAIGPAVQPPPSSSSPLPMTSSSAAAIGPANSGSLSPTTPPDYTIGPNHVLSVIHQLLAQQHRLQQQWQQRRVKLHQKLALLLFQQDVKQVLDWLDKHGEIFLRKNTGIGKTLQRARALQRSQQHFENVAKNTYSNAEKLLAAAEDLAGTGECHPEDIFGIAQQLRQRISNFAKRVQARRNLLNFSVLFHTHYKEIMAWYNKVETLHASLSQVGDTVDHCQRNLEEFLNASEATVQATMDSLQEGQQLVFYLRQQSAMEGTDNNDCILYVEQMIVEIDQRHSKLREQWKTQKLLLDMGSQFRLYEQNCCTVISQLENWCDSMKALANKVQSNQVESFLSLHNENMNQVRTAILEVMQHAQDIIQGIESAQMHLITGEGSAVVDCVYTLAERVRQHEQAAMVLGEQVRLKLEQILSLAQLQALANQVVAWINNEEQMLSATFAVPSSLQEAEQLQSEHRQFQLAIEKTNESTLALQHKAKIILSKDQCEPNRVHGLVEDVIARWRRLIALTEERHKLLTAASTYYKTLDQVLPVLDSLEEDYLKTGDWCSWYSAGSTGGQSDSRSMQMTPRGVAAMALPSAGSGSTTSSLEKCQDKVTFMSQLITKHMDRKEKFLRGCTHARKVSELFLKYVDRSLHQPLQQASVFSARLVENKVKNGLENLHNRENRVLQLWTQKKRQLDQCQEFVLLEASARRVLEWIHDEGEVYLSTRPQQENLHNKAQLDKLVEEHNRFVEVVKEQREKVRIFLELGDGMVNKDAEHIHSGDIRQWMTAVRQRYTDFSQRMDKYKVKLEAKLGSTNAEVVTRDLALDRHSDPNLEAKLKAARELEDAKRKSAKRKEFIMAELLQTERAYVKDLEICIDIYMKYLETCDCAEIPILIRGKKDSIFLNMKDIYKFHNEIFLIELEKYESLPEDVGHCFVTWAEKLQELYVYYSLHKPTSVNLVKQAEVSLFFQKIQEKNKLTQPVQSYTIKPTQRICKYPLLLKELLCCCEESREELKDALDIIANVPGRANDEMNLSLLDGCSDKNSLGDFLLQNSFTIWDPRHLIKKGRDRQVFLFDLCILFCKRINEQHESEKFVYKNRLLTSEINVTEHIEGDKCKFALWTGRVPSNETRIVLKAQTEDVKLTWVKRLRELISDRILHFELPYLPPPKLRPISTNTNSSTSDKTGSNRTSKDSGEYTGQNITPDSATETSQATVGDNSSIKSFNSSISTENEHKLSADFSNLFLVIEDHRVTTVSSSSHSHKDIVAAKSSGGGRTASELTVEKGELVESLVPENQQQQQQSATVSHQHENDAFLLVRVITAADDQSAASTTNQDSSLSAGRSHEPIREGLVPKRKLKSIGLAKMCDDNLIQSPDLNNLENSLLMKRKSIKKWFASNKPSKTGVQRQLSVEIGGSTNQQQRPLSGEYDYVSPDDVIGAAGSAPYQPPLANEKLSRKAASVYAKYKINNNTEKSSPSSTSGITRPSLLSKPTTVTIQNNMQIRSDHFQSPAGNHHQYQQQRSQSISHQFINNNNGDHATTAPPGGEHFHLIVDDLANCQSASEDESTYYGIGGTTSSSSSAATNQIFGGGAGGGADDQLIEIPPPMDACLASEKAIGHIVMTNGQSEAAAAANSLLTAVVGSPNKLPTPIAPATAGLDSAEGMAQEIEQMVRLRLANTSGTANMQSIGDQSESSAPTVSPNDVIANIGDCCQMTPEEQAKAKRKYVLMELVDTERDYVKDLGSIVEGYIGTIESMELPEDMKGKEKFVFANIQQIYEFHKSTFLPEIEKCLENYDIVGRAFVKYERRLHMYVVYCQNKPTSEYLVGEYESFFNDIKQKLSHRLNLADLLIKPVQRIMKYQLLLKDILKYTERANENVDMLKKALQVMHVVPKSCDDMMHVGRLQNFDGKITAQGKLTYQGTLLVSDNPSTQNFKAKDRRVFLFEQSLIIADCILPKKEFANPVYIYKLHILVNKMAIEPEVVGEPLRFILKNKDPASSQQQQDVVVQAANLDEKQQWLTQIKQLLDNQNMFLIALQNPTAYQKGWNKDDTSLDQQQQHHSKSLKYQKSGATTSKSPVLNRLAIEKPHASGNKLSQQHPPSSSGYSSKSDTEASSFSYDHGAASPSGATIASSSSPCSTNQNLATAAAMTSLQGASCDASAPSTKSPKSLNSKSKLFFDNFRNPLKSKSSSAVVTSNTAAGQSANASAAAPPPHSFSSNQNQLPAASLSLFNSTNSSSKSPVSPTPVSKFINIK